MKKIDANTVKRFGKSHFLKNITQSIEQDTDDYLFNNSIMGFNIAFKELETMSKSRLRFQATSFYRDVFGLKGRTYKSLYKDMCLLKECLVDRELQRKLFIISVNN